VFGENGLLDPDELLVGQYALGVGQPFGEVQSVTSEMILAPRFADSKEKNWKVAHLQMARQVEPSHLTSTVLPVITLFTA
jgi:hypothetical protein